jgi:hypothetical protein
MNFTSAFLAALDLKHDDDSQFHDIENPVCICGHEFYDHAGHSCDHCTDCSGFIPTSMAKQVAHVCEHRSFAPMGKSTNPAVYSRDPQRKERVLKVYFDDAGDRVLKAEYNEYKGDKPETREGWDGFFSFTQAHGD